MVRNIFIIGILAVVIGGAFYWYRVASAEVGSLNIYEGRVSIERNKKQMSGNTGFAVKATDVIKVEGGSRVSIILKDGSVIRLEGGSVMEITGSGSYKLLSGKMWSKVEPVAVNSKWEVETPTIVAAVRGTQFNIRYTESSSGVSVYKGKVGVALLQNKLEEKLLQKDNQFILRDDNLKEDFAKEPALIDPGKYEDWIIFNLNEDAKLKGESYVPPAPVPEKIEIRISTSTNTKPKPEVKRAPEPAKPLPLPVSPGKKLLAVSIYGTKSIIKVNEEMRVRARAKYSDNSDYDIPFEKIIWHKNENLGTLSVDGYYSSSRPTSIVLQAEFEGVISGPVTITVKEPLKTLKSVEVSCNKKPSMETQYSYSQYGTVDCTASAYYSDGSKEEITNSVSWSVSGTAGGSISGGRYTPETRGSATIEVAYQGKTGKVEISIP